MLKITLIMLSLFAIHFPATAKTIWSDYSLSYLKGSQYEVGDAHREVITFEYANGSTWGDSFMFFDRLMSDNGNIETYGEFNSRFKVTKLSRFVKQVYVATAIEMGPGNNYLLGIGTDLKVPHFKFMQLNIFHRDNAFGEDNLQATIVWGLPLGPLSYSGFMDYATATDTSEASMNFTSQLGYNIGPHLGLSNKLLLGIEYAFWNNKFGIRDVNERNANLLVKFHF